ncbi:MAG TPA: nuclear transport factor 2 family protein [Chloroflexota bacterium]|nr:nuclear transport factor 2 family protein [Chloroflexota bacterium]
MTGADATESATVAAVDRFNEAFNSHDVDAIMSCMTEDCVFENTAPPSGERFEGQEAVRKCWVELFRASPDAYFEGEDSFIAGDRCTVRWIYHYTDSEGKRQRLRGVDVFRVRDRKVHEKLAYVKG